MGTAKEPFFIGVMGSVFGGRFIHLHPADWIQSHHSLKAKKRRPPAKPGAAQSYTISVIWGLYRPVPAARPFPRTLPGDQGEAPAKPSHPEVRPIQIVGTGKPGRFPDAFHTGPGLAAPGHAGY